MSAANFLDLRCPLCGDERSIDIRADVWVRVTPDGTDADASTDGNHEFTPYSATQCGACGHCGLLEEFEPAEAEVSS
jgi:hypothetical protein